MAIDLDDLWAMGTDDDDDDDDDDQEPPYFLLGHLDPSFWKWVSLYEKCEWQWKQNFKIIPGKGE